MEAKTGFAVFNAVVEKRMSIQEYNRGISVDTLLDMALDISEIDDKFWDKSKAEAYFQHCCNEYAYTEYNEDIDGLRADVWYLAEVLIDVETEEVIEVEDILSNGAEPVWQSIGFYGHDSDGNMIHW